MDKYKVWCNDDSKWECVIASTSPTACPTNPAHTIDLTKSVSTTLDIKVNDGCPKELTLADYKQLRYNEIDWKTEQLILTGFIYDSETFSLSAYAQSNWTALKTSTADFVWPVEITAMNNNVYSLTEANLLAFWTAARDGVKDHLDSGRALKKTIFDATTEVAIDAVIDAR